MINVELAQAHLDRPIACDVIIKITSNTTSMFYMAISANIVPLALRVFTGQNQVRPVL